MSIDSAVVTMMGCSGLGAALAIAYIGPLPFLAWLGGLAMFTVAAHIKSVLRGDVRPPQVVQFHKRKPRSRD